MARQPDREPDPQPEIETPAPTDADAAEVSAAVDVETEDVDGATTGAPRGAEPDGDVAADEADEPDEAEPRKRSMLRSFLTESVVVLVAALVLSLVIKTFFAQAFFIPSISMENTLLVGDRLVVNKLAPGPFDLDRGDVVVFLDPGGWLPPAEHNLSPAEQVLTWIGILPEHADEHLIKRIIGLPGDHVVCCDADGLITVNGEPIDEPYLMPGAVPSTRTFDVVVPEGHLWVMGDNRAHSADSRVNTASVGGGFVPIRNVVGTAFVIVWPLSSATWLTNPTETFEDVPDAS